MVDFPANPKERHGFELVFSDEFGGTSLDRSKWLPNMLPHWSTLEASVADYRLGEGLLTLQIDSNHQRWRLGGDRASNLSTGQFSGMLGSAEGQFNWDGTLCVTTEVPEFRGFLPKFGFFETRLRSSPVHGYHTALWLIAHDAPEAGEIRAFEIHGKNIGPDRSRVDYGMLKWSDPTLTEELFEDWLPIDASEFHVYGLDWTPTHVDFYVDNQRIRRIPQSPQYAMQFMLGIYERPHETLPDDPTPYPRTIEVDYFRGYGRRGG